MAPSAGDRTVLRELARQIAEIAALPVHRERAALWTRLNDLQPVRPLVWITEIPWHEMDADGELTLRCSDAWARTVEEGLRRTLCQWRHFPGDMIVSDFLASPLAIRSTGVGIAEDVDVVRTDPASDVVSRTFHPQIRSEHDLEKIHMPEVIHDTAATEAEFALRREIFEDILPVRKIGRNRLWFAPWDLLIRLWGVEEAMTDLVERPALVHAAMQRLVDALLAELDQLERLNLLTLNTDNVRVGSGGYGYTTHLPGARFDPSRVRPANMWGGAAAQIFSEISPAMHEEFALSHERRWLARWGLTYYGCCEPLDRKVGMLRTIPNLRKISMSPWVDPARAAVAIGTDYVYSCKPNPAILAEDVWRPDQARRELLHTLERARGGRVEIILKDISTVRYQPQRLWEWARMASELAEQFP